jgi:hypothetical protein
MGLASVVSPEEGPGKFSEEERIAAEEKQIKDFEKANEDLKDIVMKANEDLKRRLINFPESVHGLIPKCVKSFGVFPFI